MPISADDRKAFSLKIVSADQEVLSFLQAKAQLTAEVDKAQKLDTANKNLFDPINSLINNYQLEYTALDGLTRSTFNESNIQDSANFKIGNYFYPNNVSVTVPSLSATNNVWTKTKPFALTYAIGKNYTEAQPVVQKEGDLITAITDLIADAASYTDTENTTGLHLVGMGPPSLDPYPEVQQLKTDLVTAVNALKTFLQTEVTYIVTNDKNSTYQTQNNTAISNINTVIIPALNTWLAYPDFNTTGVTAGNFNSIDPDTLAPTKLHSTELTFLSTALSNRTTFINTRKTQLQTVLGTILQDLNTGEVTPSGYYGQRYGFLVLRLDILNGSLTKLQSLKNAQNAQDAVIASIKANKATYLTVIPTSALIAPGNDTSIIQVADPSYFSVGDTVWVMAESQQELQRAIKSINGKAIQLNDIVPAKYKTTDKLRVYKDLT